jgi:hypothetical protein
MPDSSYRGPGALPWYVNSEPVTVGGRQFTKYGLPRVLAPTEVGLLASSQGGPFYAVPGVAAPEIVYLLTDPASCEFQPYQLAPSPAPRRSGKQAAN